MNTRLRVFAVLGALAASTAACGGSNNPIAGGAHAGARDAGVATDSQVAGDVAADGGATCTADDLVRCEYASKNLTIRVVEAISITDATTGRHLTLRGRIPDAPGPLPVFIWSHGGGFYPDGEKESPEWGTAIAAHGYAVIHIGHEPFNAEAGKKLCDLASIPAAECAPAGPGEEDSYHVTLGKAFDEKGVIDKLDVLSKQSVAMGGPALDLSRVAVGGWSGGSRGPHLLLGAQVVTTESAPKFSLSDSRVRAIVTMSPSGPLFGGFYDEGADHSWRGMRGPVFAGTGNNDVKPTKPELDGAVRRMAYTKQPADGTRHLLYSNLPVGVGGHGTFNLADLDSEDERVARFSRALRSGVLAFLDATLLDSADAKAWLASSNAKILAGDADWEKK